MALDPKVFKAYDIRGVVPDELDADGAYRIGRAYVDEFEPRRIAVGHDMRLTGPELVEAAIEGALDGGADVDEIGLCGTEMLYYAVCEHGYEGGFTATASHNPKQYNGFKMVRRGGLPVGGDSGLDRVRNGSSHRGQASIDRLEDRWPTLRLIHLPVHASWLNQVEIYFSVVQRKVVRPTTSATSATPSPACSTSSNTTNRSPHRSNGSSPRTI